MRESKKPRALPGKPRLLRLIPRIRGNKAAFEPPERKRERIEAGRRKLVEKARRSAERSAAAKAANAARESA